MTSVVTTPLVEVITGLGFLDFDLVVVEESVHVVEGVADVWELDTTLDVLGPAELVDELAAEEVWALDESVDFVLEAEDVLEEADELGVDNVDETTEDTLELDLMLVTKLDEADVTTLDLELDDEVPVWLLEAEVLELDCVLEALLEVEELLETIVLLLELLGEAVETVLDETVVLILLVLLAGVDDWLLEVATDLELLDERVVLTLDELLDGTVEDTLELKTGLELLVTALD